MRRVDFPDDEHHRAVVSAPWITTNSAPLRLPCSTSPRKTGRLDFRGGASSVQASAQPGLRIFHIAAKLSHAYSRFVEVNIRKWARQTRCPIQAIVLLLLPSEVGTSGGVTLGTRITRFRLVAARIGALVSLLIPHAVVGCVGLCLGGKLGIVAACGVVLAFESAHAGTDALLSGNGKHAFGEQIVGAGDWDVIELGVRSFSLNFCGWWNCVLDSLRRFLAPLASSFSGSMTHDVIMATVRCPNQGTEAIVAICKCHNGDLSADLCTDVAEADKFTRPQVFDPPKHGWWRRRGASHGLKVSDLLDQLSSIPAQYRPVTNNCHHFAKDFWNWHAKAHMAKGGPGIGGHQKKLIREIHWPMGTCKRRKLDMNNRVGAGGAH